MTTDVYFMLGSVVKCGAVKKNISTMDIKIKMYLFLSIHTSFLFNIKCIIINTYLKANSNAFLPEMT